MHMNQKLLGAGLLFAGVSLAGTAWAAKEESTATKARQAVTQTNKAVQEDIQESILNTKIRMTLLKSLKGADALRVNIAVKGTSVTLKGQVADRASGKVAAEAAKAVEGITEVHNHITFSALAAKHDNFTAHVKDATLVAQVRLRLLQEVGDDAMGIKVTATDGVVSLRGELPSNDARDRALENVKEISDVKRVEDFTNVKM